MDGDENARARDQRVDGRAQPAVAQHGGMDPARQVAQLGQPAVELTAHALELLGKSVDVAAGLRPRRGSEQHRRRHEPLLRAVVEVALDSPPSIVGSLDDAGAGGPELGGQFAQLSERLGRHFGLEQRVVVGVISGHLARGG